MTTSCLTKVKLPTEFYPTDERKVILGSKVLEKLIEFNVALEQKFRGQQARYLSECVAFHDFIKSAIPQVQIGERLEIRTIGKKKGLRSEMYYFCIYTDAKGTEHRFSVHSSCFENHHLYIVKPHERRYVGIEA